MDVYLRIGKDVAWALSLEIPPGEHGIASLSNEPFAHLNALSLLFLEKGVMQEFLLRDGPVALP